MEGMILGDHCPGQDTLQLRIFVFVQLLGCGHIFCIFTKVGVFTESTHNPDTARGGENGGQLEPAELMLCLVSARVQTCSLLWRLCPLQSGTLHSGY